MHSHALFHLIFWHFCEKYMILIIIIIIIKSTFYIYILGKLFTNTWKS